MHHILEREIDVDHEQLADEKENNALASVFRFFYAIIVCILANALLHFFVEDSPALEGILLSIELILMILFYRELKTWKNATALLQSLQCTPMPLAETKINRAEPLESYHEREMNFLLTRTCLETLEQKSPNPFLLTDRAGIIKTANRAAEQLLGQAEKKLSGMSIHEFLSVPQPDLEGQSWDNTLISTTLITQGKKQLPVQLTIVPFNLLGEKSLYIFLSDHSPNLNGRKLRQIADKELQNFVHAASHDLREPLRTVNSFGQLLKRSAQHNLNESSQEYLHFIIDASRRMSTLVQDLADYVSLNSENKPRQEVSLNQTVVLVKHEMYKEMKAQAVELIYEDLPCVIGHQSKICQLFKEIFSNCLKFKAPGRPLQIKVWAEEQGDHVTISVADNGIGIASEYHQQVFEIFRRLHSKKDYEGSGIGLASCKKIVENYGGKIWVESAPEQGSVFSFTLPPAVKKGLASIS